MTFYRPLRQRIAQKSAFYTTSPKQPPAFKFLFYFRQLMKTYFGHLNNYSDKKIAILLTCFAIVAYGAITLLINIPSKEGINEDINESQRIISLSSQLVTDGIFIICLLPIFLAISYIISFHLTEFFHWVYKQIKK